MSDALKVLPFERPSSADIVACLKEKLAEAERGEISSFSFVCEHTDGGHSHETILDDSCSVYKLIGIAEMHAMRLKLRLVDILKGAL